MKIYIATDIEGVSGVVTPEHIRSGGLDYDAARVWLTQEINAAIRGARRAGGSEFLVLDYHAACVNIVPDVLDDQAGLIQGSPGMTTIAMVQGIDDTIDVAGFVGFHARQNTPIAVLDHNPYRTVLEIRINGHVVGEYGLTGAFLGQFGIPVVFAAGDQGFEAQIRELVPNIAYANTKTALSRTSAISMHPNRAQELVADAAEDGVARAREIEPITFGTPIEMQVVFHHPVMSQLAEWVPGVTRVDSRTLAFSHDEYRVVHGAFSAMCALSGTSTLMFRQ